MKRMDEGLFGLHRKNKVEDKTEDKSKNVDTTEKIQKEISTVVNSIIDEEEFTGIRDCFRYKNKAVYNFSFYKDTQKLVRNMVFKNNEFIINPIGSEGFIYEYKISEGSIDYKRESLWGEGRPLLMHIDDTELYSILYESSKKYMDKSDKGWEDFHNVKRVKKDNIPSGMGDPHSYDTATWDNLNIRIKDWKKFNE